MRGCLDVFEVVLHGQKTIRRKLQKLHLREKPEGEADGWSRKTNDSDIRCSITACID